MILFLLALGWAFGMGWWFAHDSDGLGRALLPLWPVLVPLGHLLHWWRWSKCRWDGPLSRYSDTPWWSRGEPERERL